MRAEEYLKKAVAQIDRLQPYQAGLCYSCMGDCCLRYKDPKYNQAIEFLTVSAEKYHDGFACMKLAYLYGDKNLNSYYDPQKSKAIMTPAREGS